KKSDILEKLGKIAKKYDIEIVELDPGYASAVCDYDTPQFAFLEQMIAENFEGVITAPYISTGASDSKYFSDLSDNIFRFAPFFVSDEQLDSMHAKDENIDISTLIPAVEFYKNLMRKF
ncbi:MAG: M20/M25/M40 family metallo-hydrolase, partial [Clostridiales bacterium]|nr:M20/M25/M40 family metallo-hydrolase [Clostridiales bacterium]